MFWIFTKLITPVVIINEADSLSRDAQAALRRTMEKYMSNMRIILCANSTSKLIAPIKSRCLLMRVAAPNADEVRTYLLFLFGCRPFGKDASMPTACCEKGEIWLATRLRQGHCEWFKWQSSKSSFGPWSFENAVVRLHPTIVFKD